MIHVGDCLDILPTLEAGSVHTCITSPPYFGLRDYGCDGQIGLEPTPAEFVAALVTVFREARRVLRDDGTVWLNLGDTYARSDKKGGSGFGGKNQKYLGDSYERAHASIPPGLKPKDLIGIPWKVAFALQDDGWYLRQDLVWSKPNVMPESVRDRCTKSHEYIFLLSKSQRYYFDAGAIAEPIAEATVKDRVDTGRFRPDRGFPGSASAGCGRLGDKDTRNKRSVWTVPTMPFSEAHFATFPEALIEPCVLAGAPMGGVVLDPFMGAGTTAVVATKLGRQYVGCELNPEYAEMADRRLRGTTMGLPFGEVA